MVSFSARQIAVFAITFFCMASRRASLEGWSVLKPIVQADTGVAGVWLGACDTMYMLLYAIGEFVNGSLSEKYPVHRVVGLGLFVASAALLVLGTVGLVGMWVPVLATALWAVEGYAQSTVYPGCTKIMGQHFKHGVGKVMGLWMINTGTGNILGASLVTFCIGVLQFSWAPVLILLGSLMLMAGVFMWWHNSVADTLADPLMTEAHMGFFEALKVDGVINYSLAFSCVKLMNYAVMMWLPLYMSNAGVETSSIGLVMITYEISGAISSFLVGWISDKLPSRLVPLILLVCVSIVPAAILAFTTNVIVFLLCGALLGISHISITNMVSGVVSIELGKKKVGLISGIIDGTASLSAGLGMFLIGVLQDYGWNLVWGFVVFINILCLIPLMLLRKSISSHN